MPTRRVRRVLLVFAVMSLAAVPAALPGAGGGGGGPSPTVVQPGDGGVASWHYGYLNGYTGYDSWDPGNAHNTAQVCRQVGLTTCGNYIFPSAGAQFASACASMGQNATSVANTIDSLANQASASWGTYGVVAAFLNQVTFVPTCAFTAYDSRQIQH